MSFQLMETGSPGEISEHGGGGQGFSRQEPLRTVEA